MSEKSLCVINVVHEEDGVLSNGTLTTLDGSPRVSWTFHQDGGQFTQTLEVDEDDFDQIWNVFDELPLFKRCVVRDPDAEMNFRTHYIIGIMFDIRGDVGQVTYMVPATERDPDWLKWLRRVEATQRPA